MNDTLAPTTQAGTDAFLAGIWYFAMPGRSLPAGRMMAKMLFGQPLLFGRTRDGEPFCLLDICPHRGIPLHHGSFDGNEVECCYHGWRFDRAGRCTAIPALVEGQKFDVSRIKVRRFPCREVQGNVWVLNGSDETVAPPIVTLPPVCDSPPLLIERVPFPCYVDHAVVGLMDSAHGPFVHQSWFWRSRRSIHAKEKRYGPTELGFQMRRHAPSANSFAYKILGGGVSTEITFRLPGIRVEHIEAGRYTVVGLTAVTPVDERTTELHHQIYTSVPWLKPLRPLVRPIARTFLHQDRDIVVKQQEGLRYNPPLMLINDADVPAKWYYRLKKEWQAARAEQRPFVNPVPETTLRWRS
jgi:phenylpropionate dioxygenase-like ring-hydroxylating dioxygenase large terminal subunit